MSRHRGIKCLSTLNGSFIWSNDQPYDRGSTPTVTDGRVYVGSDGDLLCLDALTGRLEWTFGTGGTVGTSPAVIDGRVYFGSYDHNVYCVDATTGSLIWNFTTGGIVLSSPAVVDGRVFVGSDDRNLYCLDASTGERMWNYTTGSWVGSKVESSPAVANGRVFVGSGNGWMHCLDVETGSLLWNLSTNTSMHPGGIFSSPAVAYGRVYFGSYDHNVYCVDATTGSLIWDYTTSSWVVSSPAVADNKVYVSSYDGKFFCLNAITGEQIWEYRHGNLTKSSPAVAGGVVYVLLRDTGGGELFAFGDEEVLDTGWPMHRHDVERSGYSQASGPLRNLTLWTFETGGNVFSSPSAYAGRVYFGSRDGNLYCLNSSSGIQLWNYSIGRPPHSPTVLEGMVYFGSTDQRIYCLNATTGDLSWDFRTGYYVDASPAVHDGMVYVGSWDNYFYCLDAESGGLLWKFEAKDSFDDSSAAISGGKVYVGCTDHRLLCLDASSGVLAWEFDSGGGILSSPAVVDGKVYFGSLDRNVYCLNAIDGSQVWSLTTGDVVLSSPAVASGRVYIGSGDRRLYCLNATTGMPIWHYDAGGEVTSSPAIANNTVYFGSVDGKVHCLDAETGVFIWGYETGDVIYSSPAVADGRVFIGSFDDKVHAVGGGDDGGGGVPHEQRITVEPPSLDYGRVPIDYPRQRNTTTITNTGTEPVRIGSIALTEDGMGVFSYIGFLYDGRYIGAHDAATGPFVLGPGEYLQLLVDYQTITSDVGDYSGVIEIVSDEPSEPVFDVQLLAIGTTHSGCSTYRTESQAYMEYDQLHFEEHIYLNALIVSSDVFSEYNVESSIIVATEDMRGIIVEGTVKDPNNYAMMTIEITYTNSSEKLAVIDLVISPYHATSATIRTCDSSGNYREVFDVGESVYVTGEGFLPSKEYFLNLVPDFDVWLNGMPIQRIPGTTASASSNPDGVIPPTILWGDPLTHGEYDIILDIDGNGIYDGGIDPLGNSDMGSTGGFVVGVPEPWMCLAILLVAHGYGLALDRIISGRSGLKSHTPPMSHPQWV